MARLPRYTIINQPQHIIQRGQNGKRIFRAKQDYQYFHDCLDAAAYNYNLKVHAYALMPDHVHILATPKQEDSISRTIQSIGRNYVQYFNESYGGDGTLWEGRYRATVLDTKPYLLKCCRYIELNPVRAGLTKAPGDYHWSSYASNTGDEPDEMITPHREYLKLGKDDQQRTRAYRALFKKSIDADTAAYITESTLKGWAIGDLKFARRVEKRTGRRAVQLPKGRPRGS